MFMPSALWEQANVFTCLHVSAGEACLIRSTYEEPAGKHTYSSKPDLLRTFFLKKNYSNH